MSIELASNSTIVRLDFGLVSGVRYFYFLHFIAE